jgi:hypothetical protein
VEVEVVVQLAQVILEVLEEEVVEKVQQHLWLVDVEQPVKEMLEELEYAVLQLE